MMVVVDRLKSDENWKDCIVKKISLCTILIKKVHHHLILIELHLCCKLLIYIYIYSSKIKFSFLNEKEVYRFLAPTLSLMVMLAVCQLTVTFLYSLYLFPSNVLWFLLMFLLLLVNELSHKRSFGLRNIKKTLLIWIFLQRVKISYISLINIFIN